MERKKITAGMSKEELIAQYKVLQTKLNRLPASRDWIRDVGSQNIIFKQFGSWNQFVIECTGIEKVLKDHKKNIYKKETLLNLLNNYVEIHKTVPTVSEWEAEKNYPKYLVIHRLFGSFGEFLQEAGYSSVRSSYKHKTKPEDMKKFYRKLLSQITEREPSGVDWDKNEEKPCSSRTVIREFGSWSTFRKTIKE